MGNDGKKAGTTTATCPLKECTVVVQVDRRDGKKLSKQVAIDVQGPSSPKGKTAPIVQRQIFEHLTPCKDKQLYKVSITLDGEEAKGNFAIEADPADAQLGVPGGATGTFLFELSSSAWIKFKVLYEKPPPGAKAEIVDVQFAAKRTSEAKPEFSPKTNADGLAEIRDMDAGTCDVEAMVYEPCVLEIVGDVQST